MHLGSFTIVRSDPPRILVIWGSAMTEVQMPREGGIEHSPVYIAFHV